MRRPAVPTPRYAPITPRRTSYTPAYSPAYAPATAAPDVRRVTDDRGRGWTVRAIARGRALFFQSDIPGVRSESRPTTTPLGRMTDADLRDLLERVEE